MHKVALYSLCPAIFLLAYFLWDKLPLAVSYLLLGSIAFPLIFAGVKQKGG